MLNNLQRHTIKVATILTLMAIAFAFLHSEVGLFNYNNENHDTHEHDYCKIVNTTITFKKTTEDVIKLKVDASIIFHCVDEINRYSKIFTLDSKQLHAPHKSTEVYLFSRALLI